MTDRLSPTDAAFLYAEDATAPLHVGGVVIAEPQGEFDYQRVIDVVAQRLGELPRFRQVVRTVPGHFARPVWVDDAHFDLSYHVRRSSLPHPGSAQQLDDLVGRLISRPLDRSRPLWELYIVEGLAGGRVALVNKTHEALVNRIGAVDIAAAVLDETARTPQLPAGPWIPAPAPSAADLVIDAVADLAAQPTQVIDAAQMWMANLRQTAVGVLDTGAAMADVVRRSMRRPVSSSMSVATPAPRIFAASDIDLAAVKAIRAAHGGTVNDVILAIVAGAVRSWMLFHGDPVTGGASLATLVPMSVRPDEPGDAAGVVSYVIDLPISEPSPVVRLHQVSFQMESHTASGRQVGADALLALGRFAPATLHAMGARVAGQLSRRSYDLLVTNVPGPQRRLYAAGDPVAAMYPVVPLVKGHALAVGCTSYRGRVYFGFTADRDAMPDVVDFAQLVADAAGELADTVGSSRRRARAAAVRRRPKASANSVTGADKESGGR